MIFRTDYCLFRLLNVELVELNVLLNSCFHPEPYGRFRERVFGVQEGETAGTEQGFPSRYGRILRPRRRSKVKSEEPSAPPDKDPVMLLNEFGQKRDQLVSRRMFYILTTVIVM